MIARILGISLAHRYAVVVATLVIGVFGALSLLRLPIDAVPDITNNQVQINVVYPALSPLEIEKQITFPIETSLAGIAGLEYTRSLSRNGFSQITAVFSDSVDIYFARQQVGERLTEAKETLPDGAEPRMGPISTGLGEIYMWSVGFKHPEGLNAEAQKGKAGWQPDGKYLTPEGKVLASDLEKAAYLREIQDWVIRPQLRTVTGVAGVDSIGGYVKQYTIEPEPLKLAAFGLSFSDLIEKLDRNNVSTGAGYIEHRGESYVVRAASRVTEIAEIEEIPLAVKEGRTVRIRDVASVGFAKQLRTGSASEDGSEVVVGTALMLLGNNSRIVASAVDERMREINTTLPPDVTAKTVLNRTKLVDATVHTVEKNLIEGAILVIVILFLMLGNFRAAFITALAIPFSMLMTAIGMVQAGISGNLMSLGAIDFGLIVDGAVIIVENCLRKLAHKQHEVSRPLTLSERLVEVQNASTEMIRPSAYGQAIIITVYVPVLFLTGVEGKMFNPMAMTVVFALLAAFVLSITFIPAMVALLISGRVAEKENAVVATAGHLYQPALTWALRKRGLVIVGATLFFIISGFIFTRLGQEFIPTLDEKDITLQARRLASTSLTQSQNMQFDLERRIKQFPETAFVFSKTGTAEVAADPMPPNISDTFIILKPHEEWPDKTLDKAALVNRIEEAVENIPGNNYEFTQPIQMRFNELIAGVRGDVAVKVFGDDFEQLLALGQKILAVLRRIPGAADAKLEQTSGLPTLDIQMDRVIASRLGIDAQDFQDVVSAAIGGKEAGFIFQGDRRFPIVVRLPEAIRDDLEAIRNIPVPLSVETPGTDNTSPDTFRPGFIPLGAIANVTVREGPNQISRENGKRRIVVQANVRGSDLGTFVAEAQKEIARSIELPSGYWLKWGGQYENLQSAKKRLGVVVPLCFAFIFVLLYSAFGSVRQALIVFSGVPLALSGGVFALWLRDMPFSISAAVGFIALSGVAVLNGLVMVSCINQLREEGLSVLTAVREGAALRLRPVLMTALVASLGFIPMAIAMGTGAEVQKPIATVVIGGLISATALTLFILPALYTLCHRDTTQAE